MGRIFVSATHTARSKTKSGVQSVVCGLLWGLSKQSIPFCTVEWIPWRNALSPLKRTGCERLGLDHSAESLSRKQLSGSWLVLPEVMYRRKQNRVIRHALKKRMRVAAIPYDAIPVSHPELVRREAAKYHAEYLKALCDVDLIVAISNSVAEEFRSFVEKHRLRPPPVRVCSLPTEVIAQERAVAKHVESPEALNILCVSTLEPRKNHQTLLEAFDLACAAITRPQLNLHLAGDRHRDAEFIVDQVEAAMKRNPKVMWHGRVTEEQLSNLYRECDFTVYPSVLEGFGLPIGESLWHRRPCICADFGVMAETARGGGCVTADVRNPEKLRDAVVSLATKPDLRQRLLDEIERRPMKTWAEYAAELCDALEGADR